MKVVAVAAGGAPAQIKASRMTRGPKSDPSPAAAIPT